MARVPVSTGNSVQQQALGGERFRYSAARDLVGPEVERFGQQMSRAAETWDAIEATRDEADAMRLDVELRNRARTRLMDGENGYLNKRGFAASDGQEEILADLNGDAESLLGTARSERAREMARRAFQSRIATAQDQIGSHAMKELESARLAQANARIEGALVDAVDARGTDQFAVQLGLATQELASNATRLGWSPEQLADETEKMISGTYAKTALAIDAEDGEPTRALAFIEENKGLIRPDEQARLTAQLAPRVDGAWAQDVVQSGALERFLPEAAAVVDEPVADPTPGSAPTFERIAAITVQSESGGNPNAVSSVGARGLMQVMPATARDPGYGIKPSNGSQADDVRVGREYLAKMQEIYGGDLSKMWAAYNAGPGRVDEAVRKHGSNWLANMPAETRAYVAKNVAQVGGATTAAPGAPGVASDPRLDSRQMRAAVDKYVEANPGLSERRVQALYAAAEQAVNVARADRAQAEQDADRRLQDWLTQNKPGADDLTSLSQIPASIMAGISPSTAAAIQQRIQATQARAEDRAARAEAGRAADLEAAAVFELYTMTDAELARVDVRQYTGRIGIDKLGPWADRIEAAREKQTTGGGSLVSGDRIASRIDTLGKDFGASRALDAKPDQRKLWADVRGFVEERVAGRPNKDVSDEELRSLILAGLQEVTLDGTQNILGFGGARMPRAQVTNQQLVLDDIPAAEIARIRAAFAASGIRNPTTRDIFDAYQRARARGDLP